MTKDKNVKGFDFIGDIHGQADALERLLHRMGYTEEGTTFRNPNRYAFFVGDFIDRGTQNRRVVEIVRGMVENNYAFAVMGNHEYNAICYNTPDPNEPYEYLRPHTDKNYEQHKETLKEFEGDPAGYQAMIDWFWTLPLFTHLGAFRVVHACWHPESRKVVEAALGPRAFLTPEFLVQSTREGTEAHHAVETMLKGAELDLPAGTSFLDKDGNPRTRARVRWWLTGQGLRDTTWQDAVNSLDKMVIGPEALHEATAGLPPKHEALFDYECDEQAVFFGHYWLTGTPERQGYHTACLDYSAGRGQGHKLVAYRRDAGGSRTLDKDNFVWVDV